jgi:pyruvate formate lyase activating enzyme
MDAANIDLKTFSDSTSKRFCGAPLKPVLDNLRLFAKSKSWLEVTTLIIPGINDTPEELNDIASFISEELGCATPWHISAFFPARRMTGTMPTPVETILNAAEIGKSAGLRFVYPGNTDLPGTTFCPVCGKPLIERRGYRTVFLQDFKGICPSCGDRIPGVWDSQAASSEMR